MLHFTQIGVKIMLVPFTTSLSQQASFKCPISGNDLTEFEVCKPANLLLTFAKKGTT